MTATVHRIIAATGAAIAALGGLVAVTDPAGLGVDAYTWSIVGNWMSLLGGLVAVAATFARTMWPSA